MFARILPSRRDEVDALDEGCKVRVDVGAARILLGKAASSESPHFKRSSEGVAEWVRNCLKMVRWFSLAPAQDSESPPACMGAMGPAALAALAGPLLLGAIGNGR